MKSVRSIVNSAVFPVVILGLLFVTLVTGQTPDSPVRDEPRNTDQIIAIRGQITNKQEQPLPDYVVEAISSRDEVTYLTKTAQYGTFKLPNLYDGVWSLQVKLHGTTLEHRKITLSKGMKSEVNFAVKATGSVSGFLLDSTSGAPLSIDGNIYMGLLTDEEICPVRLRQKIRSHRNNR